MVEVGAGWVRSGESRSFETEWGMGKYESKVCVCVVADGVFVQRVSVSRTTVRIRGSVWLPSFRRLT